VSQPINEGRHAAYTAEEQKYAAVQQTPEFQELRKRYRGFVIPVTIASLAWYFLYVLLAAYAPGFMGTKVLGNINIGLVMGFLQFVSTFAVTQAYISYADRKLDPASARIRDEFEGVL
jgi:uncharacterized membrane protein (DUF485 family)